ncbi:hypothetical protein GCM10009555_058100 [Acrocarpospora macrocephala]|uniref:Uncharacterized protein n=1 Tax=Acrocarpospora macrocephala TaxID=150177 RepID=A0A5M3WGQ3_9ACTN|nr:hypothetical protein [Acrocarpospora macrocephala]GES08307.1 hypothetical protein Amac_019030 [Acrocarpospora macrocephala]
MTFLLRFGAVCGLLSGLFIALPGAVEAFTGETAVTSFVLGVSPALAVPLLTALHIGQMHAAGALGSIGYAVNLIGLGLFGGAAYALNLVLYYLGETVADDLAAPTRAALLGSALVFTAGTVLFTIAMVRARVYPRIPVWIYGIALPVFAIAARLPDTPLTSALHVVVGATLAWLATAIWRRARAAYGTPRTG